MAPSSPPKLKQVQGDDVQRPKYGIDREAHSPNAGFLLGDGDYSCPVLSLGFMCLGLKLRFAI